MPAKYIPASEASPELLERRRAKARELTRRWRERNPEKNQVSNRASNGSLSAKRRERRSDPEFWNHHFRGEKAGVLRMHLMEMAAASDTRLQDLEVLATRNDPFTLDGAAAQRDGKWFAEQVSNLVPEGAIHLRGLHYRLVGRGDIHKPDGNPYINDDDCFKWLNQIAKPARWLGYIPFEKIVDNRNEPPLILIREPSPRPQLDIDLDGAYAPCLSDAVPRMSITYGLYHDRPRVARQPYRIILIGEKSSLSDDLRPIAEDVGAELLLPSGELSETLIYDFAKRAAEDGRPAVVLYFSDFDPSGNQMPVTVSRKLQALKFLYFPKLVIEVHHVGLTLEQAKQYNLPSTPMKDGEKRKSGWIAKTGREQTEIDALIALHPSVLGRIAREAVAPFYDAGADRRLALATNEWLLRAGDALARDTDLPGFNDEISVALDLVEEAVERLDAAQERAKERAAEIPVPNFIPPEPAVAGTLPEPLFDSEGDWIEQTRRLRAYKALDDE